MNEPSRRRTTIPALALIALALAPVAAHASTASSEGPLVTYQAGPGEANRVTVEPGIGPGVVPTPGAIALVIVDPGADVEAGPGCQSVDAHTATCIAATDGATIEPTMDVLLGDQADEAHVRAMVPADIAGGSGDDRLRAALGTNAFLTGGDGDDVLTYDGGNHTNLCGEEGDDVLNGSDGHDHVLGGVGDDVLNGNGLDDVMVGGASVPAACGEFADPVQEGSDGIDAFFGGDGPEVIFAQDGRREPVSCGAGVENLILVDDQDAVADDCENVRRPHRP